MGGSPSTSHPRESAQFIYFAEGWGLIQRARVVASADPPIKAAFSVLSVFCVGPFAHDAAQLVPISEQDVFKFAELRSALAHYLH